tara:strand:- start:8 stop:736 length:729 start_codon:yes stop_codon:yes gene_type:complete
MAEDKKGFIMYADLINNIDHLTIEEKGILFNHILEYVNDMNPILEDRILLSVWKPIKGQLKRDLEKYQVVKSTRSDQGAKGNLKRWNKDLYDKVESGKLELNEAVDIAKHRKVSLSDNSDRKASQSIANVAVNVNDNDNVNDNVNDINKKQKRLSEFDTFWDLYDKKKGTVEAKKKFLKLSQKDVDRILLTVKSYVSAVENKQFLPLPTKYLNQELYKDEVEMVKKKGINRQLKANGDLRMS